MGGSKTKKAEPTSCIKKCNLSTPLAAIENLRVRALLRYYSGQADWTFAAPFIPSWEEKIGTNQASTFYLDFSENIYREGVYFPSRDAFEEALAKIGKDRVRRYLGVKW